MNIIYKKPYLHSKPLPLGKLQSLSRGENCQETALLMRSSQLKFFLNIYITLSIFWFCLKYILRFAFTFAIFTRRYEKSVE